MRYVVALEGEGFLLRASGYPEDQRFGFFATRWLRDESPNAVRAQALALVTLQLERMGQSLTKSPGRRIWVSGISEGVKWWVLGKGGGFTWYPEGTE